MYPPHDPLLLVAGEAIHQVVRGLEADVREEPRHQARATVQLRLYGRPVHRCVDIVLIFYR